MQRARVGHTKRTQSIIYAIDADCLVEQLSRGVGADVRIRTASYTLTGARLCINTHTAGIRCDLKGLGKETQPLAAGGAQSTVRRTNSSITCQLSWQRFICMNHIQGHLKVCCEQSSEIVDCPRNRGGIGAPLEILRAHAIALRAPWGCVGILEYTLPSTACWNAEF